MIRINSQISRSSNLQLEDVYNIKKGLVESGYYEIPSYGLTPYPDDDLFDAVKEFQEDQGLTIDGIVNPEGETLEALNRSLDEAPMVRSPTIWCPQCGAPHGGSKGDLCPDCASK